jgi:phosphate transport system permease protein
MSVLDFWFQEYPGFLTGEGSRRETQMDGTSNKMKDNKNNDVQSEKSDKIDSRYKIKDLMLKQSARRKITDKVITALTIVCVVAAIIPLGSILVEVIRNGAPAISIDFLTQPPGSVGSGEGGIGPAIQGTLIVVALASIIGAPVGVLAGIYLSEFSAGGRFAHTVRFVNDILTDLPSIVIGIVGYVTLVLAIGSFSVLAGAFALSILMIPIIVRVTEETTKIVPNSVREAGYSLGIPKWKVVLFIVLRSAKTGVITGIVLAISRIAGETAPLIMTILGTSLFFTSFVGPTDALPLRIWRLALQPYDSAHSFGWGAALILILIVLGLSIGLRYISQRKGFRAKTITI